MNFVLKDNRKYSIPGFLGRLHLATVSYGFRTFVAFTDRFSGKKYIEEDTGGSDFAFITDDNLALALEQYLTQKGILDPSKPDLPDNEWLKNPIDKKYFT